MHIKKIIVQTTALKALAEFYKGDMQLPVELTGDKEITIRIGSTDLLFKEANAADPFYHFAFNIPANKIQEAKDWLQKRVELIWIEQYQSEIADFTGWHAKSVYFYDPAGNILELIARSDLDNSSDEPFSSKQFLYVSEVGLVFKEDELDKETELLLKKYNLSYFDKQQPLPQFKAIGDDEGLFIVVPENRNWYLTTKPARQFPMQLWFRVKEKEYELSLVPFASLRSQ